MGFTFGFQAGSAVTSGGDFAAPQAFREAGLDLVLLRVDRLDADVQPAGDLAWVHALAEVERREDPVGLAEPLEGAGRDGGVLALDDRIKRRLGLGRVLAQLADF